MGILGDFLLKLVMESDSKLGQVTNKSLNKLQENDSTYKRRILMDAQQKAHNSGNKELEKQIEEERKKY